MASYQTNSDRSDQLKQHRIRKDQIRKKADNERMNYAYPVSTGDLNFAGFGCARSPSYKSR